MILLAAPIVIEPRIDGDIADEDHLLWVYRQAVGLTGEPGSARWGACDRQGSMHVDRRYRNANADHLGQDHARPVECFRDGLQESAGNPRRVKGLKGQWLLRVQNDPDTGYAVSQWESEADMQAFWESPKRGEAMAVLQPFFVNQYTITNCTVQIAESY